MQSTLREIRGLIFSRNNLIAWFAASVICVLVAPFGSDDSLSLPMLATYWFTSNALTLATGEAVMMTAASRWMTRRIPLLLSLFIGSVIAAGIITLIVWFLNMVFFDAGYGASGFWHLAPQVFTIAFVIAYSIGYVLENAARRRDALVAHGANTDKAEAAFFKRLPVHLGRDLYYLSTQDHYVEAVTAKGKHMVLMRFSDAVDELEGENGMQIHRSYWASTNAVENHKRENGKLLLVMKDGAELPVSRSYLSAVRDTLQL